MDEPYYPHAEAAAHGLTLELLLATSSAAALPRHGSHLSDFAPPTMLGSRLYHRLVARSALPHCVWVTGPMETLEHLGWAVGLAEHAARDRKTAYLLDLDPSQPLRVFASGVGRPLEPGVVSRLSVLGIPAAAAWPSDLEGVRIVLPERRFPPGVPIASAEDWIVIIAQSVPDTAMGVLAPRPGIDGVIFAAGIRDHTVRELRGAVGTLSSAGLRLLGLVAMGPVRGAGLPPDREVETPREAKPIVDSAAMASRTPSAALPGRVVRAAPPPRESAPPPPVPAAAEPPEAPPREAGPVAEPAVEDAAPPLAFAGPTSREMAPASPSPADRSSESIPPPPAEEVSTGAAEGSVEAPETAAPAAEEKPIPLFADWHEDSRPRRRTGIAALVILAAGVAAAAVFFGTDLRGAFERWRGGTEARERTQRANEVGGGVPDGFSTTPSGESSALDTMRVANGPSQTGSELDRVDLREITPAATEAEAKPDTFLVYAGSFASRFDALDLVDTLRTAGIDARIVSAQVSGLGLRHRVVLGAFSDAADAWREAARLREGRFVRNPQVIDTSGRPAGDRSLLR